MQVVLADANVDALLFLSAYASANEPTIRALSGLLKEESGIPVYPTPERAARALRGLVRYGDIVRQSSTQ